ncbi:MAG: NAD(+)/NADH kinase [Candidatus Bathyarchaeia archaeon]
MFKTVGIVSRLDSEGALGLALKLRKYLSSERLTVTPEVEFARLKNLEGGVPLSKMEADLIVTVGGDGTVLKTSMGIPRSETPILAVNMGRRGYLTEVEPENAVKALKECLLGKYRLEEHAKISAYVEGKRLVDSLNEVLITPANSWKMLTFEVDREGRRLIEQRADGLIVATPTGSTAHAFSAGGPILERGLDAFILAFICPSEYVRSMVVSSLETLQVKVKGPKVKVVVTVDGRYIKQLPPDEPLTIERSKNKAVFVRFDSPLLSRSFSHPFRLGRPEA